MESGVPMEAFEDVDNESGQMTLHCFGIPLILRDAFPNFYTTELSQFSGMTIVIGGTTCRRTEYCQQSPNGHLEPIYEDILHGLTLKHFSLRLLVDWEKHKSCPGFVLGKKMLREMDSLLEELSVELQWKTRKGPEAARYFQEEFLQDCQFSRLKTFRLLNEESSFESEWSDLIKTVVSTAPNLQVLHTKPRVNLRANLLEGSPAAVHVAAASYSTSGDDIPESAARRIQVQEMHLWNFGLVFSLERFNTITSMVLKSSHNILSSLRINVIFLAPLMNYGIRLENVKRFWLALDMINLEKKQPPILRIANTFDFTRTFPNLNTVTIIKDGPLKISNEFNEMIMQVNATLQTPTSDRAANVQHLKLHHINEILSRRSSFSLLAQIFPNVQKLSIQDPLIALADIQDIWTDLREIDYTLWRTGPTVPNHDSVFCGIFPEEVAQLREQDEEYLRRVNIVPVMPTIAYLTELRNFKFCYQKMRHSYRGPLDDPTCLFSKVTPLIAFQRCPNLAVTLRTDDERLAEALGHLTPYVPVVFANPMN